MRIKLRADALLFVPAPENVPQLAGEVFGRFARRRASPPRTEVNLLIDAVPLRAPIDETRSGRRADKIVEKLVRPPDLKLVENKFRPVSRDSNPRCLKVRGGVSRQYARIANAHRAQSRRTVVCGKIGFAGIAVEHGVAAMSGLALDRGAVGAVRERFGHMTRA